MTESDIHDAVNLLRVAVRAWRSPAVTIVSQRDGDPFKVLLSCILSLRTHDRTTGPASDRLFALADTPEKMLRLTPDRLEGAIFPVGFYRQKALQILGICRDVIERFGGRVPGNIDELLSLKGVGRKTANLVLTLGFGELGICVDTHVHRIANRWGYVRTRTPEETEFSLRDKLPREYWIEINDLLVTFGQNLCTPVSPKCSICPLISLCDRVGVTRSR